MVIQKFLKNDGISASLDNLKREELIQLYLHYQNLEASWQRHYRLASLTIISFAIASASFYGENNLLCPGLLASVGLIILAISYYCQANKMGKKYDEILFKIENKINSMPISENSPTQQ